MPTAVSATNRAIYPTFEKCYASSTPCAETGQVDGLAGVTLDYYNADTSGQTWIALVRAGI
jgi:hypothetical protein